MVPQAHRRPAHGQRGLLLRRRLLLRLGPLRHARGRRDPDYLPRPLPPRTDLHYDQPDALGALLHLDACLGTNHADRFTEPDGLWDHWGKGVGRLGYPSHTPAELRRWTDLHCDFANGWSRP
nr:DUF6000 family protein [Streptomyces virginiae]